MANTRKAVSNSFSKGLVMDFNPLVTSNQTMTNALNATLVTFNGNEMQLQQDMGNGRVETAFLPEGYIPVGTCEYGDIIYIVSYNPLENKSQIGCFPSPERNITSDEVTELQQSISANDFQTMNDEGSPTGFLKATTAKRILYGNNNLNPGDKYIIYEEYASSAEDQNKGVLEANSATLSDYGNSSHKHNTWPKLVKVHVVSIEDSGKIVNLDASVKWYDNDYYLDAKKTSDTQSTLDFNEYRSLVSSAYATFQSKVSGKLALLIELEAITGFNCAYSVYTKNENVNVPISEEQSVTFDGTKYTVYFHTSWTTDHNDVNPIGFVVTESKWGDQENAGEVMIPYAKTDNNITTIEYEGKPYKETLDNLLKIKDGSIELEALNKYALTNVLGASKTYECYCKNNYQATVNAVVQWGEDSVTVPEKNQDGTKKEISYEELRPITKASRCINTTESNPNKAPEKKSDTEQTTDTDDTTDTTDTVDFTIEPTYDYVFNLDRITKDTAGNIVYQTRGRDGIFYDLKTVKLYDDIVNNYFHLDVLNELISITLPTGKQFGNEYYETDLSNMVWNYKVAPAMPYGILEHLAVAGTIDFSKVGKGEIDLTTWKYYNEGDLMTLTWGLDAYPENNKGIAEVCFDFYDNQGFAAGYHVSGKTSYSGVFTEQITMNIQNPNYRMNAIDCTGESRTHAGEQDPQGELYYDKENAIYTEITNPNPEIAEDLRYRNDAGTIHSNFLYLVKITVKYTTVDILGNYDTDNISGFRTFYRWIWTNNMFNSHYYNVQDFAVLQPQLSMDFSATFNTNASENENGNIAMTAKDVLYYGSDEVTDKSELYKTLAARVYAINQDGTADTRGNMNLKLAPGLSDGYNTFNLDRKGIESTENSLQVSVYLGKSSITKDIESPSIIRTGTTGSVEYDDAIMPITDSNLENYNNEGWDKSGYADSYASSTLLGLLGISQAESTKEDIYNSKEAYPKYVDSFSLNMIGGDLKTGNIDYLDEEGNVVSVSKYQTIQKTLGDISTEGINLTLTGIAFSKAVATETYSNPDRKRLRSITYYVDGDAQSLEANGLSLAVPPLSGRTPEDIPDGSSYQFDSLNNYHAYFKDIITWGMGEGHGASQNTRVGAAPSLNNTDEYWIVINQDVLDNTAAPGNVKYHKTTKEDLQRRYDDQEYVQWRWRTIVKRPLSALVWCRPNNDDAATVNHVTATGATFKKLREAHTPKNDKTNRTLNINIDQSALTGTRWPFDENLDADRMYRHKSWVPFVEMYKDGRSLWAAVIHRGEFPYVLPYHCPLIYDEDLDLYIPVADYFIGQPRTQISPAYYQEYLKSPEVFTQDSDGKDIIHSLGDMFASLFCQLYIVDGTYTNKTLAVKNYISLQPYTEYWNKDIIIDMPGPENNANEYITLQNWNLNQYIDTVCEKAIDSYTKSDAKDPNVDFILQGTRKSIKFQFAVPYNADNLLYTVQSLNSEGNIIELIEYDPATNGCKVATFDGNVTSGTLYTWTGSTVVPFGSQSSLMYAKEFRKLGNGSTARLAMIPSNRQMSSKSFSALSQIMQYDGYITWHGLDRLPRWQNTYSLLFKGGNVSDSSHNPMLKDLPKISIFNEVTI